MLRHLSVQNYALIDHQELSFDRGLTAITGETGSGKSILLGAFGLLLGARAETKSIKDAEKKCIVEAEFDLSGYQLSSFFEENDLDYDASTSIRREIAPGGKSRAFINDTPVSLQVLKALGEQLVDIHSQHENSIVGDRAFQFEIVDAFAAHTPLLADYRTTFTNYQRTKSTLDSVLDHEAALRQELDYLKFQWTELDKANLESIELESMEQEVETLSNAELIKSHLNQVNEGISGDEHSVLSALHSLKPLLAKISGYHQHLGEFATRLESCSIELRELAREIEVFEGSVHFDPQKIASLQEQLGAVYQLQQKHRMQTIEELIRLRDEIAARLSDGDNMDERIEKLHEQLRLLEAELARMSVLISEGRTKGAALTEAGIQHYFKQLSLDHAELKIQLKPSESYNSYGKDEIQFLFRANPGSPMLPVKQVASGGEISRVMLALKAAISGHKKLPVLILDEIDQGVSGEVGKKIGEVLRSMSAEMQLITITHLPQIAGMAQHHFKVQKSTDQVRTNTEVLSLKREERVKELAEMLSGKSYTAAALENARELMRD